MVFHGMCPSTGETRFILKISIAFDPLKLSLYDHVKRSIAERLGV